MNTRYLQHRYKRGRNRYSSWTPIPVDSRISELLDSGVVKTVTLARNDGLTIQYRRLES